MKDDIANQMRARRLGVLTQHELIALVHADCPVCRSEGMSAHSQVTVTHGDKSVIATLYQVTEDWLPVGSVGLTDQAWERLDLEDGALVRITHAPPLASLSFVRQRIFDDGLTDAQIRAVVSDIVRGAYSDIHLTAFVTATAAKPLVTREVISLTRAMIDTGERIDWGVTPVADKHCVGGLPANRTTPIVVSIVAANGLLIPKTSSRAITSPAGTADTMETLTRVDLNRNELRRVIEKEGGCFIWGDAVDFSPADTAIIRVERALNFDSAGSMVASVLSKKIAAGATHVVIDIPVGPTAKIRNRGQARELADLFRTVALTFDLKLRIEVTDGSQPIGRGIGPALEARDVRAVLSRSPDAPQDLRDKSLSLAGAVLELTGKVPEGEGIARAAETLDSGRAWEKFLAICKAQGGIFDPPVAKYQRPVNATRSGRVAAIDNHRLARVAKLAGAPDDKAAGLDLHVRIGDTVRQGTPLYTLHTESIGELSYVLDYVKSNPDIIELTR
ncbi:MAG: thymidine phosphorylase [Hyphomonas sp.]|nr:thymidine phosphorylase family protein [Hyphomonas sp.]MBB40933.1 thymidine phosphorylase [Hyphomonas sp.]|tara:strand:+ start:33327 stop:34835 length:1509 start_codon:yes stop_codon:yes gene_type:complete